MRYILKQNPTNRWYIENARDPQLAWSHTHWVDHENGEGLGHAHVCSFTTQEEAESVAKELFD